MKGFLKSVVTATIYAFTFGAAYAAGFQFVTDGGLDDLKEKISEKLSKKDK